MNLLFSVRNINIHKMEKLKINLQDHQKITAFRRIVYNFVSFFFSFENHLELEKTSFAYRWFQVPLLSRICGKKHKIFLNRLRFWFSKFFHVYVNHTILLHSSWSISFQLDMRIYYGCWKKFPFTGFLFFDFSLFSELLASLYNLLIWLW